MQRRGLLLATIGAIASAVVPTLAAAKPTLDRVNPAPLITHIKKQLGLLCEHFIFEPNDEITRAEINKTLSAYLEDIRKRKGIYDFTVLTDSNSAKDIANNQLNIDVAIKPVEAREFIYIPIRISSGPVKFTSI